MVERRSRKSGSVVTKRTQPLHNAYIKWRASALFRPAACSPRNMESSTISEINGDEMKPRYPRSTLLKPNSLWSCDTTGVLSRDARSSSSASAFRVRYCSRHDSREVTISSFPRLSCSWISLNALRSSGEARSSRIRAEAMTLSR